MRSGKFMMNLIRCGSNLLGIVVFVLSTYIAIGDLDGKTVQYNTLLISVTTLYTLEFIDDLRKVSVFVIIRLKTT